MKTEQEIAEMIEILKIQEQDPKNSDAGQLSARIQLWALEWVMD